MCCKLFGDDLADPARSAGDENRFSLEVPGCHETRNEEKLVRGYREYYRKEREVSTSIVCPGPAENGKIYPVVPEYHTFPLKENTLTQLVLPTEGYLPTGIDDPVPRNIGPGHDAMKSVPRKPWLSLQAGKSSNHAIRAHVTSRYSSRGVPYAY
jgi:hypothetical protein